MKTETSSARKMVSDVDRGYSIMLAYGSSQ